MCVKRACQNSTFRADAFNNISISSSSSSSSSSAEVCRARRTHVLLAGVVDTVTALFVRVCVYFMVTASSVLTRHTSVLGYNYNNECYTCLRLRACLLGSPAAASCLRTWRTRDCMRVEKKRRQQQNRSIWRRRHTRTAEVSCTRYGTHELFNDFTVGCPSRKCYRRYATVSWGRSTVGCYLAFCFRAISICDTMRDASGHN